MGKLEKLRSRFFFHMHKKDRVRTALRRSSHQQELSRQETGPVDIPEEPHEHTPADLSPTQTLIPPQQVPQSSGHNRSTHQQRPGAGGRLYWNEARRIYSDPIPLTSSPTESCDTSAGEIADLDHHTVVPCSELAELERANVSSVSGWAVDDDDGDDDDDVFLENCEDLSGELSVLSCHCILLVHVSIISCSGPYQVAFLVLKLNLDW